MVFDEWRTGIPVAFIVTSRTREQDLHHVLQALQKRVRTLKRDWGPTSIIVDNAQAELNTLRYSWSCLTFLHIHCPLSLICLSCPILPTLFLELVLLLYNMIWPEAKIFLCLWHVRKAWAENAVKKIPTVVERATVLQMLGDIMYGSGCHVDEDPIRWALRRLDTIMNTGPHAVAFMRYMNETWRSKTAMWCAAARRIPHAGQNTNAAIESYHSNLKSILNSSKERFVGRRMDWLIYHLMGDVLTHYWYGVQCKAFGFIRNTKQEGIVVTAIIRANAIPDTNVLICMDEDVAYVASINNRPKVWTIHSPDSEWAQCDCPIAKEGMICKHTVKVFKMLHPDVQDGVTFREAGTKHGIDRVTTMSQCFARPPPHPLPLDPSATQTAVGLIREDMHDNEVHMNDNEEHISDGPADPIIIDSQISNDMITNIPLGDAKNPIDLSQERLSQSVPKTKAHDIYIDLTRTAEEYPALQDYLLADLRHIRGKQTQLIARGVATMEIYSTQSVFPERMGDNSLKRHQSFLEMSS